VDGGNFDWAAHPARQPLLNQPDPSYHGAVWVEAVKPLGPVAYIVRMRTCLLRDLGAPMAPMNAFLTLQGLETLPLRMERHNANALAVAAWLAKHYTYIGAPWTGHLGPDTPDVGVGNGGLSLRCVSEMISICESSLWRFMPVFRGRKLAYRMTLFRRYHLFPFSQRPLLFFKRLCLFAAMSFGWRNTLAYYARIGIQEDHVLSVYAPCVYHWIRIPAIDEAAIFSVESNPRLTMAEYGVERPFGCHAWEKYDRDFWLSTFPHDFAEAR
jgi:hypothetical protein